MGLTLPFINDLSNSLETTEIVKSQNSFLESTWGKALNFAVDVGLKIALPDVIEDHAINLKDLLLKNGLKDGISSIAKTVINVGKSLLGIKNEEITEVDQLQGLVEKGGFIKESSKLFDDIIKNLEKQKTIPKETSNLIKNSKNAILTILEKNISNNVEEQKTGVKNLNEYIKNWNEAYKNKDMITMEKEFEKIKIINKNIIPLEKIINNIKEIEAIQNLVKEKDSFEFSKEEINLSKKLS